MKFLWTIKNYLNGLFYPEAKIFKTQNVIELPNTLDIESIYLVGENGNVWSIAFICPCGCDELIQLNTLRNIRPCWRINKMNPISIFPSINRTVGCKSHFFIRKGKIIWIHDSPVQ